MYSLPIHKVVYLQNAMMDSTLMLIKDPAQIAQLDVPLVLQIHNVRAVPVHIS